MFRVNDKDTRTTPCVDLVFLSLTLNMFTPSSVSIVKSENVNAGWECFALLFMGLCF